MGSASEVEYHLLLARDLDYLQSPDHVRLESEVIEIKRMLATLLRKVKADSSKLTADSYLPTRFFKWLHTNHTAPATMITPITMSN